jgi:hypothetical protein
MANARLATPFEDVQAKSAHLSWLVYGKCVLHLMPQSRALSVDVPRIGDREAARVCAAVVIKFLGKK